MNPINSRRLELGLRSAYTSALCLVVLHYIEFGGAVTYLAPVISVISNPLCVGHWIDSIWQVTYASFIGSGLGTLVSLTLYINYHLHLLLLFIALTIINRVSSWERLSKVYGSLTCMLTSVYPSISDEKLTGGLPFIYVIAMVMIPYLLTGISLLLPIPKLASTSILSEIQKITTYLQYITDYSIEGFDSSIISSDIYVTEAEYYLNQIESCMDNLMTSQRYVANEAIYFHSNELSIILIEYITITRSIINEYRNLQIALTAIPMNTTQATFSTYMKQSLSQYGHTMNQIVQLINNYIYTKKVKPLHYIIEFLKNRIYLCWNNIYNRIFTKGSHRNHKKSTESTRPLCTESTHNSTFDTSPLTSRREPTNLESGIKTTDNYTTNINIPIDSTNATMKIQVEDTNDINSSIKLDISNCRNTDNYSELYFQLIAKLQLQKEEVLYHFRIVRSTYIHALRSKSFKSSPTPSLYSKGPTALDERETNVNEEEEEKRNQSTNYLQKLSTYHHENTDDTNMISISSILHTIDSNILDRMYIESTRLSSRNLSPRGAYIGRLLSVSDKLSHFQRLFHTTNTTFSSIHFIYITMIQVRTYLWTSMPSIWSFIKAIILYIYYTIMKLIYTQRLRKANMISSNKKKDDSQRLPNRQLSLNLSITSLSSIEMDITNTNASLKIQWAIIRPYIQPMKIAAAISITCILIVKPEFANTEYTKNGTWAAAAIAFIRQDNSSSSFLTCYQRLEGTLIGAVFAFAIFELLQCSSSSELCVNSIKIPIIVGWIALCSCFKEGPRHGYSAVVSALTPVVILFLPTNIDSASAWRRVMLTFIGVAIYLMIDIIIFPNRTDILVRKKLLMTMDETKTAFSYTVQAIKYLLDYLHSTDMISTVIDKNNNDDNKTLNIPQKPRKASILFHSALKKSRDLLPVKIVYDNIRLSLFSHEEDNNNTNISMIERNNNNNNNTTTTNTATITINKNVDSENITVMNDTNLQNLNLSQKDTPPISSDHPPVLGPVVPITTQTSITTTTTTTTNKANTVSYIPNESNKEYKANSINTIVDTTMSDKLLNTSEYQNNIHVDVDIVGTSSTNDNQNPSIININKEESSYDIMCKDIQLCQQYINQAENSLKIIAGIMKAMDTNLMLGEHEPDILYLRPFPLRSYVELSDSIRKVTRSLYAVLSSAYTLSHALMTMIDHHEHIHIYMKNFYYMSQHLFHVSELATVAITSACTSLHSMIEEQVANVDASSLITLGHSCDIILNQIEDYFSHDHMQQVELENINPLFVVTWMNVFESMIGLMRKLSELGKAMLILRETESLNDRIPLKTSANYTSGNTSKSGDKDDTCYTTNTTMTTNNYVMSTTTSSSHSTTLSRSIWNYTHTHNNNNTTTNQQQQPSSNNNNNDDDSHHDTHASNSSRVFT